MSLLDDIQGWLGANVPGTIVTSGQRSAADNTRVHGAVGSYHMSGQAVDLIPSTGSVTSLYDRLGNLFKSQGIEPVEFINEPASALHGAHVHVAFAKDQSFAADGQGLLNSTMDWLQNVPGFTALGFTRDALAISGLGPKTERVTMMQEWLTRGAFIVVALLLLAAGIFILAKGNVTTTLVKEALS